MKINKIKLFVNNNIKSKNAEKLVMDTLIKEGFNTILQFIVALQLWPNVSLLVFVVIKF